MNLKAKSVKTKANNQMHAKIIQQVIKHYPIINQG